MLRSVSSLAMALALAILCACSESESDPCEAVDCGPGQCVTSSEQAACECPSGYVPADLSCRRDVREGDDHGDYFEAATPVELMDPSSQWVESNLDHPEDVDLFSFHVTAGRIYRFSCYGPLSSGYDPSCSVELLGADGLKLPGSAISIGTSIYLSAVLATQEGTVYARVKRNHNSISSFKPAYKYSLVDLGPDDFANTLTEATPVPIGTTVSGDIELTGDVDVVALDVVAGRAYRLKCVSRWPSNNCGMRVRGPGGEMLYETKPYNPYGTSDAFDLQVMQGGRHTVELFVLPGRPFFDGIGEYTFSAVDLEP
ncbi:MULTISPECIES: hypothetical protein [Corallococcus]|uniref:hypothetical protein n=1 Tax=Corallococcus TaxID=83461 RepID=UPI000EDE0515|nr:MULTISPECIES: hypothetical protein [Corallococcus]NPD25993.1 hypothetical protein [Corallococcus exiguus]RKI03700.1 hypothetical protein D7Y04_01630 [Corallococcus sp. AB038B]